MTDGPPPTNSQSIALRLSIAALPWLVGLGAFLIGHRERTFQGYTVAWVTALGSLAYLLLAYRPSAAWTRRIVVLWCVGATCLFAARPVYRAFRDGELREWSVFHYYLGARYFPELGYDGLYDQALAADREGPRKWASIRMIRDLRTLQPEPTHYELRIRSPHWTDSRWANFRADVEAMQPTLSDEQWEMLLGDRGYNGTPPYTAVLRVLAAVPWSPAGRYFIVFLDLGLFAVALIAVGRTWGAPTAWAIAAWSQLFFGMWKHTIGGFFQLDYLAALLTALAAVAVGRFRWAGVLLAWACMSRIFPGFFLVGLVPWFFARRRLDGRWPPMLRPFATSFLIACLVMAGLGMGSGRGPSAWPEFITDMADHTELHPFGKRRLGLQHVFTAGLGDSMADLGRDRREHLADQKPLWGVTAAVLVALWAWSSLRPRKEDPLAAMALGLLPCFALIVLSRYYGGVYAALALLIFPPGEGAANRTMAIVWAIALSGSAAAHYLDHQLDRPFEAYLGANLLFGSIFVFLAFRRRFGPAEQVQEPAPSG